MWFEVIEYFASEKCIGGRGGERYNGDCNVTLDSITKDNHLFLSHKGV